MPVSNFLAEYTAKRGAEDIKFRRSSMDPKVYEQWRKDMKSQGLDPDDDRVFDATFNPMGSVMSEFDPRSSNLAQTQGAANDLVEAGRAVGTAAIGTPVDLTMMMARGGHGMGEGAAMAGNTLAGIKNTQITGRQQAGMIRRAPGGSEWLGENVTDVDWSDPKNVLAAMVVGGPRAKTANQALLALAKKMEKEGAMWEEIATKTGWWRKGGQWQFEISDADMKLVDPTEVGNMGSNNTYTAASNRYEGRNTPIGAVIEHPELAAAYPEMFDPQTGLRMGFRDGGNYGGNYDHANKLITINSTSPERVLDTATHELSHAVQRIEDFPAGSDPSRAPAVVPVAAARALRQWNSDRYESGVGMDYAITPHDIENMGPGGLDEFANRAARDMYEEYKLKGYEDASSRAEGDVDQLMTNLREAGLITPDQAYWRNAGEVQARTAAARRTQGKYMKKKNFLDAEDVPLGDQILSQEGGYSLLGSGAKLPHAKEVSYKEYPQTVWKKLAPTMERLGIDGDDLGESHPMMVRRMLDDYEHLMTPEEVKTFEKFAAKSGSVFSAGTKGKDVAGRAAANSLTEPVSPALKLEDMGDVNYKIQDVKDRTIGSNTYLSGEKKGTYIGSPDIKNSSQLGVMRKKLVGYLTKGMEGRGWYDRSSRSAMDLSGDRPNYSQRFGGINAATSRSTNIVVNRGQGIKGYNQAVTGSPIDAGRRPNMMRPRIEEVWKGDTTFGRKEGPFFQAQNLLTPNQPASMRPTNDIRQARAFGYKVPEGMDEDTFSKGLTEAQHRFMDSETQWLVDYANKHKLGGFDDWTNEKVQASIWTAQKAEQEGTTVAQAAGDFATDLDKKTININYESVAPNHLAGLPEEGKNELFRLQQAALTDEKGRSYAAQAAGALTRPGGEGAGMYLGNSERAGVTRILGETGTKSNELDQPTNRLARGVAALEGLPRGQAVVGRNMMAPAVAPTAKTRDMGRVDLGHQVTRQEMLDIENELIRLFGKDANGNPLLIPVTDPSGFSIIKTGTDTSGLPKGWEKSVKKFVKDQYGTDIAYGHNAAQGTFGRLGPTEPAPALTGDWDFKPSAYLKEIDWAFAHADDTVTRNVDAYLRHSGKETERIDDFISSKFKNAGERSKILQETRRVLASGGLQGLRDAVKSGALPVILMGAFGLQLSEEQPQAQNTLAVSPRG